MLFFNGNWIIDVAISPRNLPSLFPNTILSKWKSMIDWARRRVSNVVPKILWVISRNLSQHRLVPILTRSFSKSGTRSTRIISLWMIVSAWLSW